MPNYSKGRIYRIVSPSHPDEVYYGSTTQTLGVRICGHRKAYHKGESCSSKSIIAYGDAIIILVEMFPCQSVEELRARESWYILNHPCVNKTNPAKMTVERRREKEARWYRKYSQQTTCECGGVFNVLATDIHRKTLRHIAFIETGKVYVPKRNRIQCECGGFYYSWKASIAAHNATAKHKKYLSSIEQ